MDAIGGGKDGKGPGARARVAVLRALRLGDLLCAVPALRSLRAGLPEAEILLIGLPWARPFAARFARYLDGFLEFPGFPGMPERPPDLEGFPRFLAEARAARFDLVIQMHGDGILTNPLAALLGARRMAGYHRSGQWCPDGGTCFPYPEDEPEVLRNLHLVERLGFPSLGTDLEFPVFPEDRRELDRLRAARDLRRGEYACVHPGARDPARRWPPDRFAAVADALAAMGLAIAITGSPEEADLERAVARSMRAPAAVLHEGLGLGALAALLEGARIVITNDTGISHLAAALRVPSVVVFSASDPARWAPLDRARHRPVIPPGGTAAGGPGVDPVTVIAEAEDLVGNCIGAA